MKERSSTTSKRSKNLVIGFGNYCCVTGCKSAFYDKNSENTNISLFTVFKTQDLRNKWLDVLKHVRWKEDPDSFEVKKPKQENKWVWDPFQGGRSNNPLKARYTHTLKVMSHITI